MNGIFRIFGSFGGKKRNRLLFKIIIINNFDHWKLTNKLIYSIIIEIQIISLQNFFLSSSHDSSLFWLLQYDDDTNSYESSASRTSIAIAFARCFGRR